MLDPLPAAPDASPAYRLWDDLYAAGLKLALSDSGGGAEEARERLARAIRRSLEERNAMWERISRSLTDRGSR